MLAKLMKYELKATSRFFLPTYAALLIFAAVSKSIFRFSDADLDFPAFISMFIYFTVLVGMFVMTLVVMIQRFHKNLLSDEGYLMFTLPADTWKHIISKLLVSILWTLGSTLAALISIIIIAFDKSFYTSFLPDLFIALTEFFRVLEGSAPLFVLEFIIGGLIYLASGILIIYASIAIGHLSSRHRVLVSFGAFLALSTLSQILFICAVSAVRIKWWRIDIDSLESLVQLTSLVHGVMWFIIGFFGLLSAGCYCITNYILKRRLNLE